MVLFLLAVKSFINVYFQQLAFFFEFSVTSFILLEIQICLTLLFGNLLPLQAVLP